jgi:hypothetical protein
MVGRHHFRPQVIEVHAGVSGLVLRLAFPGGWPGLRDSLKDPEHDRVASETLFQLLDEFLARHVAHDEPAAIFDEYLTWRRAQSWYKPSGAHSSPPEDSTMT